MGVESDQVLKPTPVIWEIILMRQFEGASLFLDYVGGAGFLYIEDTFDVDANAVLRVSMEDTGKNKITITNDKGRPSEEEIDRMVAEAEKFKPEDDAQKERVEARNQLENFCYHVKNMVGEQLGDKIGADDKAAIEKVAKEGLEWLDAHQLATKEELDAKMKEIET